MNLAQYGQITSVVVSQDGNVVFEAYIDGEPDALRNTRSCTKTVAGMLVGLAIDRGVVAALIGIASVWSALSYPGSFEYRGIPVVEDSDWGVTAITVALGIALLVDVVGLARSGTLKGRARSTTQSDKPPPGQVSEST